MRGFKYTPKKGDIFIVRHKGREVLTNDGDGAVVISRIKSMDNSSLIYKCKASDSNIVVSEVVYSEYNTGLKRNACLFDKRDYTFDPVGPDVIRALGIAIEPNESVDSLPAEQSFTDYMRSLVSKVRK